MISVNVLGCCVSRDILGPLIRQGKLQVMQYLMYHPCSLFSSSSQSKIEIDDLRDIPIAGFWKNVFVKEYNKEILDYIFARRSEYLVVDIMNARINMLRKDDHIITDYLFVRQNRPQFDKAFHLDGYESITPYEVSEKDQIEALDRLVDKILSWGGVYAQSDYIAYV